VGVGHRISAVASALASTVVIRPLCWRFPKGGGVLFLPSLSLNAAPLFAMKISLSVERGWNGIKMKGREFQVQINREGRSKFNWQSGRGPMQGCDPPTSQFIKLVAKVTIPFFAK